MSRGRRGLVDGLLRAFLPEGPASDAVRGDLREEYGRRRASGALRARIWYGRQATSVVLWSLFDRLRGRPWPREAVRPVDTGPVRPDFRAALADGVRVLRRSPGYAFAVVATLGLAMATTVTVFTVVRGVLLRDLPYPEPDRLVRLDRIDDGVALNGGVSYPDVEDWRARVGSLSGIAVHTGFEGTYVTDGVAEIWEGRAASRNLLDVLGVAPDPGAGFDEVTGAVDARSILISHALWERRFGADPEIVGRSILLDGTSWQVVGVLPRSFAFPSADVDMIVPLRESAYLENRGAGFLRTVARLAPGRNLEAAREEVRAVAAAIDAETGEWGEGVAVRRYADVQVGEVERHLWLFMAAVSLVLVVACANVAGLALARTESRRTELAVRASLGAGRARLAGQVLVESVTLALVGGALGVGGAVAGVRGLLGLAPADLPRRAAVQIDPAVLAFATVTAVVAGVLFGWLPALRAAGTGPGDGLRGVSSRSRGARRTQELLAAGQIAVAVVLLTGAGLLLRSFGALTSVDPGFRTEGTLVVELGLDASRYEGWATREAGRSRTNATLDFHDALMERVRGLPGVTRVGISTHPPFSAARISANVVAEAEAYSAESPVSLGLEMTGGDYFGTLGLPVRRGRLPWPDEGGTGRMAVVNDAAARRLWPGRDDPLGARFTLEWTDDGAPEPDTWFTVAGVVPDVHKRSLDEATAPLAYFPLRDFTRHYGFVSGRFFYLLVATEGEPLDLLPAVRRVVAELDPLLPIRTSGSLEEMVRETTVPARFRTLALGVFALLGIVVALLGVYGVMAFGVARGIREIGIRMALGASATGVRRRVLAQAARVVAVGGVLGAAGALIAGPVLRSALYEVPPRDLLTMGAVLALTLGGSLLAAWLPALRASRVEPMAVLRDE